MDEVDGGRESIGLGDDEGVTHSLHPTMRQGDDAALTRPAWSRQRSVSSGADRAPMSDERDSAIRRAIGGEGAAIGWVVEQADSTDDPVVIVMAALLGRDPGGLERARGLAVTSRDRQLVEIAAAHLRGESELVDALARDHLVDHPDSLIVAWIAADSVDRSRHSDPI